MFQTTQLVDETSKVLTARSPVVALGACEMALVSPHFFPSPKWQGVRTRDFHAQFPRSGQVYGRHSMDMGGIKNSVKCC